MAGDSTSDVAVIGVSALTGSLTACGPAGGVLAFLTGTLAGVLGVYGGSAAAPAPALTGGDIDRIVNANQLTNDVRLAWASIEDVPLVVELRDGGP